MSNARPNILLGVLLSLMLVLAVRAAILTVGQENTLRANLWVMSRSALSFQRLNTHIDSLQSMTADIDQYSLAQIKEALNTTRILISQASIEFKAQQDSWTKVQGQIKRDKISFLEIRQQLDDVQKLQSNEILRLKKLLDEVIRPSLLADLANLFFSFVLGVISSIAATHIYSRWKGKEVSRAAMGRKSSGNRY